MSTLNEKEKNSGKKHNHGEENEEKNTMNLYGVLTVKISEKMRHSYNNSKYDQRRKEKRERKKGDTLATSILTHTLTQKR